MMLRAWRRFAVLWLLVLSGALWCFLAPIALTRSLSVTMTPASEFTSDLSVEWTRAGSQLRNGRFLEPAPEGQRFLELRPSGQAVPGPMSFHLYEVRAGDWRLTRADLKAGLRDPRASGWTVEGAWTPGIATSGIIFQDRSPGRLRIPLPPDVAGHEVILISERTAKGGPFEAECSGNVVRDTTASAGPWQELLIRVRPGLPAAPCEITSDLPNYPISEIALHWRSALVQGRDPSFELSVLKVRTRLWGFSAAMQTVPYPRDAAGGDLEPASTPRVRCRAADGAVRWSPPAVPVVAHAMGAGTLWLAMLLVWGCTRLVISALGAGGGYARRPLASAVRVGDAAIVVLREQWGRLLPGWLTPERAAILVVALAHIWLASWSPVLYLPDTVEYAQNAQRLCDSASLAHFDAWRLPGLSFLLVPFDLAFDHPEEVFAWALGAGGVLASWLTFLILRRWVTSGWAVLGMLLVGLDPVLLSWERHPITETPTMVLVCVVVYLGVRACDPGRPLGRIMVTAFLIGLLSGLGVLIRANVQVVAVVLPVALALSFWRRLGPRRALGAALACAVGAAMLTVPWAARTWAVYGTPGIVIGRGYAKLIFAWHAGEHDLNQTALYDREHWQEALAQRLAGRHEFDYMDLLDASPQLAAAPGRDARDPRVQWVERERRCLLAAEESRARRGPQGAALAGMAMLSHLGLYSDPEHPQFRNTDYYTRPLRGQFYSEVHTNWGRDPRWRSWLYDLPTLDRVAGRTLRDIGWVESSPHAAWFARWYAFWDWLRAAVGGLFLLGVAVAIRGAVNRRDVWPLAIAIIVLGNAAAFAWVVLCGETRYSEPLLPLLIMLATLGAARAVSWARQPGFSS